MSAWETSAIPSFSSNDSCICLQGEAEWAPSGEAEVGGEDYGSVPSPGAQHATSSQQGQVQPELPSHYTILHKILLHAQKHFPHLFYG